MSKTTFISSGKEAHLTSAKPKQGGFTEGHTIYFVFPLYYKFHNWKRPVTSPWSWKKKKLFDLIDSIYKLKEKLLNPKVKNYRNTFWMAAPTRSKGGYSKAHGIGLFSLQPCCPSLPKENWDSRASNSNTKCSQELQRNYGDWQQHSPLITFTDIVGRFIISLKTRKS